MFGTLIRGYLFRPPAVPETKKGPKGLVLAHKLVTTEPGLEMAEWKPSNHKADEKEAARNRKKLMKIIKLPQNQVCADCPIKRVLAPHCASNMRHPPHPLAPLAL